MVMRPQRTTLAVALTVVYLGGCTAATDRRQPALESPPATDAGARYRAKGDLEGLHQAVGALRIGMSKADVERLLGGEGDSPTEGQHRYTSSTFDRRGWPIGLIVEYRWYSEAGITICTGRLEEFYVTSIGE
jgi:hypothetical protein